MIVVDLETSGALPNKNSILSIGAIELNNPDNTFYGECKLRDSAIVDTKALEINGFTIEQITNCSSL